MVQTRPTGRTPHEIIEIQPDMLDCSHPYGARLVTVGFGARDANSPRVRTYRCRECGTVTYTEPSPIAQICVPSSFARRSAALMAASPLRRSALTPLLTEIAHALPAIV
jgi:hypothetical protein